VRAASARPAESEAVTLSVKSGNALYQDAPGLGIAINQSVAGDLVAAGADAATIVELMPGLTFTVLAPAAQRFTDLQHKWEQWERDRARADVQAVADRDRSVFNLSSIVVLAKAGQRTLLLTGDVRSDDVLDGLRLAGLLDDDAPRSASTS
jgi:hypothetical protein